MPGHRVSDHGPQPITKAAFVRVVLKDVPLLKYGKHHFLNDLFGRVLLTTASPCRDKYQTPVAVEKFLPSHHAIALTEALQERCLGGRVHGEKPAFGGATSLLRF
jgi:hypothetical protein